MVIRQFPPVELADEYGLLAAGGDLEIPSLLLAYKHGIFPWPVDEDYLTWFAPAKRAVLFLDKIHIPRTLLKASRRLKLNFRTDHNFKAVIRSCAELTNRGDQPGTWITPELEQAYIALHEAGYCHSFEAYQGERLAGGFYGVLINHMFAAESMFYRLSNASKLAFLHSVDWLKGQGVSWVDCQVITPLSASLGAEEIPRDQFMKLLKQALPLD